MQTYRVAATTMITATVCLLTLEPRHGEAVRFYPGQYASIGFRQGLRPSPMRCFSIVSSPGNRRQVQFAMRVQGPFTQAISALRPGDTVRVQGPFGSFVVDERYDRKAVLFAGGIGITPFMSMLRTAAETQSRLPMTLLYSCRSQSDIPFFDELLDLQRRNPRLRVVFFVSDGLVMPQPGVHIVPGKITDEWIDRITSGNYRGSTYFLCGPQAFMDSMQRGLINRSVHEDFIVSESFAQATKLPALGKLSIPAVTYALAALVLLGGTGAIAALDIARAVPHTAASASTSAQTTSGNATSSYTSTSGTSNTTTNTTPSQAYYQPPVSSVS